MIYAIPVVGWLVGLALHASLAVPLYFAWNAVAPKFFYFLPPVYHHIGFWELVCLLVALCILKIVFYPRFVVADSMGETPSLRNVATQIRETI